MVPKLILGDSHQDDRGTLKFNNDFDATLVKRVYSIENADTVLVRGWQGHRVEQRWFTAVLGKFKIELIKVDDWENPTKELNKTIFELSDENADILYVPKGYISSLQAMTEASKLLAMSDYKLNEIQDEYKFSSDYFKD
tara:strand:- start:14574 stop:14990 length:417 start_codon:yes stop_codon:yes gene_type:complete